MPLWLWLLLAAGCGGVLWLAFQVFITFVTRD